MQTRKSESALLGLLNDNHPIFGKGLPNTLLARRQDAFLPVVVDLQMTTSQWFVAKSEIPQSDCGRLCKRSGFALGVNIFLGDQKVCSEVCDSLMYFQELNARSWSLI